MNTLEVSKLKSDRIARTLRPVMAAAKGEDGLPTKIELLKCGIWDTPNHGIFAVTPEDLIQYKTNYDNGAAQVVGAGDPDGIMIDYEHMPGVAAGWIKGLEIDGDTLIGIVTWTARGKEDLLGENFKYISPEFYPASRGGWEDPEQYGYYIPNVLAAAGLVNRPLFKGLKPIMASADSNNKESIFISASEKETTTMPTLEDVRAKKAADLNDEEKAFVAANKDQFNADEQASLGLEVTAKKEETTTPAPADTAIENKNEEENVQVTPELAAVAASIKSGDSVVIKASEHKMLMDTATQYQKEKAAAIVASHVARGAIKPEAADKWTTRLVAASGQARTDLEEDLKGLNDNPVLASQQGSVENAGDATGDAWGKIEASANKIVADSKGDVSFTEALKQARRENPELAKQLTEERAA